VIWHILTGEYPPSCGGVGDYTSLVARGLVAAGDTVRVWTPSAEDGRDDLQRTLPDRFGPRSRDVLGRAWLDDPGIVLVQYVPNAFGARGANLPFCRWVREQAHSGCDVRVMFHEPYFYYSLNRPWRNALAAVQRMMAAELIKASRCIYMSSSNWVRYLSPYAALPDSLVLPIPSTIPERADPRRETHFRASIQGPVPAPVIGHFGTYGEHLAAELMRVFSPLVERPPDVRLAFLGQRSVEFLESLQSVMPDVAARTWASGWLDPRNTAAALRACDLLLQPYPDGVTTRRTSVMAGLQNGVATVTTDGFLTEDVWREALPAALAPAGDTQAMMGVISSLLGDAEARRTLARRGRHIYRERFSIGRTIDALRASVEMGAGCGVRETRCRV
jgi:glycosyltransferase involved in cell wall biosynthesis